jgi:hypothetical protein
MSQCDMPRRTNTDNFQLSNRLALGQILHHVTAL